MFVVTYPLLAIGHYQFSACLLSDRRSDTINLSIKYGSDCGDLALSIIKLLTVKSPI